MSRLTRMVKAPMMDTALGYLYAPLYPLVQRVRIPRRSGRRHDPADILLPEGYVAEVVATGLNAPVHCCFDDEGFCYVSECGHKIESRPRILRVDVRSGDTEVFFDLPEDRWRIEGAFTGACWLDGRLYFTNTDAISRLEPDGRIEDIVTGLPWGDHMTNYPVVGPDGKLYWGQGSTTNTGVVGGDNYAYEWLREFPHLHDVPAEDVTLLGRNYEFADVRGDLGTTVRSGAYMPFGTETSPGQVVPGDAKASGAILRCNPDGSDLEVVAWGLRNPYGLAFSPDGRLLATNHGIDERSARYVVAALDDLYEITEGAWYGWPDFSSGIPLDDPSWPAGRGQEPVLAEHPDPDPPKPLVTFEPHAAANGLGVSRDPGFGFVGDAFVALYGDVFPVTTRAKAPAGYKVVRVDLHTGTVVDFAVNKLTGPASKLPHGGFERPSHCAFGPDGALYVVDWGQISIAPEIGGIRMPLGTGTLWRIRRTGEAAGDRPAAPVDVPVHAATVVAAAGCLAAAVAGILLARGRRKR